METEKKSRRKQRKQVNKEETDIELAEVEKKEEVKVIDEGDNKTWTESEQKTQTFISLHIGNSGNVR